MPTQHLLPRVVHYGPQQYGAEAQNWDVAQSPEGLLYVANSGGVLQYDGQNWTTYQLPGRPIVRAAVYHTDRLYTGGYGEFGYFTTREGQLLDYVSLSDRVETDAEVEEIWNIELLADGTVVFQSFTELFYYAGDSLRRFDLGVALYAHPLGDSLLLPVNELGLIAVAPDLAYTLLPGAKPPGELIIDITGDRATTLIATANKLLRYDWAAQSLSEWSTQASRALDRQQVNRVIELQDGTIAVGTIRNGLYLFSPAGELLRHLSHDNGLSNNTVLNLFEDQRGDLWVALERGLDVVMRSEPLRYYRQSNQPMGGVTAATAYGDNFYVGTNQGLFVLLPGVDTFQLIQQAARQVWELIPTDRGLLCGHNWGSALIDGESVNWLSRHSGTWQSIPVPRQPDRLLQATYTGLYQVDLASNQAPPTSNMLGLSEAVRTLIPTGPRDLLALHPSRGAYRITLTEDWSGVVAVDTIRTPDLIRPLATHFGDTLLVQTEDTCYNYIDGTFMPLAAFRGVAHQTGRYFLPGAAGSADWFVADRDRLTAYRGSELMISYPIKLHRPDPQIVALADGTYLFGLEEGFALGGIKRAGTQVPDLLVRREDHDHGICFHFALPLLDRAVQYRSRLLGFDAEWSEWTATSHRDFTNLPPGDYHFEVEADWYGIAAGLPLTIPTPWYQSVWAYMVYLMALLGCAYLLLQLHQRRLRQQAADLEAKREKELAQERMRARNEQLERDIHQKSKELADTTLTLAKKNEMLLGLKEDLDQFGRQGGLAKSPEKILHTIDRNLNNEDDWAIFESHFTEVHAEFLARLRRAHPRLTTGEQQLAAYLRMDLPSKEIAPLLRISVRGIENKRYRLRKKLGLESNDSLNQYLQGLA
ncbi:hypothetical protein LEM8419_01816 [Neolewinella maritima]|uniref:HTH luxR-type domain-containing protein n=1 Tax=Neolewinella maritima TaxID=1383882 RepID=A0ABM9B1G7_9BACT|nr:hypothetical protein LEM8419_01816 [Neolewinella maritima]